MKVSSRIDGSICGAILSSRPLLRSPRLYVSTTGHGRSVQRPWRMFPPRMVGSMRTFFYGNSWPEPHVPKESSSPNQTTKLKGVQASPRKSLASLPGHANHGSAPEDEPERRIQTNLPPTKQDLLALVDYKNDEESVDEHFEFFRDPYRRRYASPDGPNLVVSKRRDDFMFPAIEDLTQADDQQQQILTDLRVAVLRSLRHQPNANPEDIYQIYLRLPEPRMSYIHYRLRHNLLRVLGRTKRNSKSMLRYFAVLSDIKDSGLSLSLEEWNTAMSFASRYVGTSTETETESALSIWKEMELDASKRANHVTFNILFDVASKAGNFTLAEMLYKEMESRRLPFNRYHHVTLIHFFGLKMDADGVRAAYREMVEAGEMIDTVVLNCVISGLLRSGEEDAAERVYARMKEQQSTAPRMPERDYFSNKVITKVLMMFAKIGREHSELRPMFSAISPMVPDLQTYRILVNHYAIKVGDLNRVVQFLDEMKWFKVPLHGSIFLSLFKGFGLHGARSGSDWSEHRLLGVWSAFIEALDRDAEGLYISTWTAMWVLRAFKRCSSQEKVFEVYDTLSSKWDLDHSNTQFMLDFLHRLSREDSSASYKDGHIS